MRSPTGSIVARTILETSAHKLEALGHALEADAAEIQGNTQVVARGISSARSGPALPTRSRTEGT